MLTIKFFGCLADIAGVVEEQIPMEEKFTNLLKVRNEYLKNKQNKELIHYFADKKINVALNHKLVPWRVSCRDGDTITFFPKVSGG